MIVRLGRCFFPQDRPSNKKGTLQTILVKLWTPPPAKFYGFEFAAICSPTFVGLNESFSYAQKMLQTLRIWRVNISQFFHKDIVVVWCFIYLSWCFQRPWNLDFTPTIQENNMLFTQEAKHFGFMGSTAPQLGSRSLLTPTSQSVSSWTRSSCYLDVDNPYWCSSLWLGNLTRKMASSESLEHWAKTSDICM